MISSELFFLCLVFCLQTIFVLSENSSKNELSSNQTSEATRVSPFLKRIGISKLIKKINHPDGSDKNVIDQKYLKTSNGSEGNNQDTNQNSTDEKSNIWGSVPIFKNLLGRVCFKDIGCFTATEFHDLKLRPIPLLPMSPDSIDPVFHIFTPKNMIIAQNFSYNSSSEELKHSLFDPQLHTVFITHGFRSGFEPWIQTLKDSIFNSTNNFNVICVIWEKGAKVSTYHLSASNARVVGATIAFFITTLVKTFDISNDKFYLIGHSIGAHVVSYAAKRLNEPQVARVTGLDPAGPGFHFDNKTMRLHYTDATFVDALHTDIGVVFSDGLGLDASFGHLDFYPNGGSSQPGCRQSKGIYNLIHAFSTGEEISCSHSRAHKYAANVGLKSWSDCQPIGYECIDYETFIEGRCFDCRNHKCQPMGLNIDYWLNQRPDPMTLQYKYFLNLNPKEEFCVNHYQFAFHITQDSDEATGIMDLVMDIQKSDKSNKTIKFYKIMSDIQIGEIHTFLMTYKFKLEDINSMSIQWKRLNRPQDENRVNKGKTMKIPFIEINFMSHLNESVREKSSYVMCPKDGPDTQVKPRGVKIEYLKCKLNDIEDSAKDLAPEILVPFTRREDIFSNDFERLNPVVNKVVNSKVIDKNNRGNLFG